MKIRENISLDKHNTFRIGGPARYFVSVDNVDELKKSLEFAKEKRQKIFILGGGSNTIFDDEGFDGLVVKNGIKGIRFSQEGDNVSAEVGGGEEWDRLVRESVKRGFWGLENLSIVPGLVGSAPIQNVGCYGVEVSTLISKVKTFNTKTLEKKTFSKKECRFAYRDSFFKKREGKRYFITKVFFRLKKDGRADLSYKDIKNYFEGRDEKSISQKDVRQAVIKIRTKKLPDIKKVGTAGSFFKNPTLSTRRFGQLRKKYPGLKGFAAPGGVKVHLAYVIDKICGLKGYREGSLGLHPDQPLVVVNYGGASFKDLIKFKNKIEREVFDKTKIRIKTEAVLVGK